MKSRSCATQFSSHRDPVLAVVRADGHSRALGALICLCRAVILGACPRRMTARGHQFQWRCAAQSGPLPTSRQDNLPLQAVRGQTAFRSPAPGARNRGSRPIAAAGSREGCLGSTTSRSKPPHDRSAVRPEADTMNQTVRSRFTPPEREPFKPARLRASSNSLNYRASNIHTKTAVVRLRQRKRPGRDGKRPKMGFRAGARGSDK
jgi:hypothetical protein